MFGKLENHALLIAPKTLTVNGMVHYHPSDELYRAIGYLPVVQTPCPESLEGEEAKYYASTWEEQDGKIVRVWTETEPLEEALPEPTEADKIAELEQKNAELSNKLDITMSALDALIMGEV